MAALKETSDWHPLSELQQRIGHALETFYRRIGTHHHGVSGHVPASYEPPADLSEMEAGVELRLEMPGMTADDIEVVAGDGRLTIRGEKTVAESETGRAFLHRERYFGAFSRTFTLPDELDPLQAEATVRDGVLTVSVPAKPAARRKARKIKIAGE